MTMAIVTTKGQIVIPSKIRQRLNIKKGARLCVTEKGNQIILQPLTKQYFENVAGVLKTKGKLSKTLIAERLKDKKRESR